MKNLKLLGTNPKMRGTDKTILVSLILISLLPQSVLASGPFDDLVSFMSDAENQTKSISQSFIKIAKFVAGAAAIVSGISFLYLNNQQSDVAKKMGNVVIGFLCFFGILAFVDLIV